MTDRHPIMTVGVSMSEHKDLDNFEALFAADGTEAVEALRAHGHTILTAILDAQNLKSDLEELVVYIRQTYPDILLAVIRPIEPEIENTFKLLGVSHFLDRPLSQQTLNGLLRRTVALPTLNATQLDWAVTINKQDWVEISVPSKTEYVSRIQELIDLLERSKLDQNTRDELTLAIDELVTNAMEWGNKYEADKKVKVSYFCNQDQVMLKVEDEGKGFSVAGLGDPTQDLGFHKEQREQSGKRPGGFGIHMIRSLMDEFIYNDRGNTVILTKFLTQSE